MNTSINLPRHIAYWSARLPDSLSGISWFLYRIAAMLEREEALGLMHRTAACAVLRDFEGAAAFYTEAIRNNPTRTEIYSASMAMAKSGSLGDQFFGALVNSLKTTELRIMMSHIASAPRIYQPSQFWLYFSTYNALQIELGGIENFKQTVNKNYFNWTGDGDVEQQLNILDKLSGTSHPRDRTASLTGVNFPADKQARYSRLLELLLR